MVIDENTLLPLVLIDDESDWDDVLLLGKPHLASGGLTSLRVALHGRAKTVVLERHYFDKDYRDTFTNYHSKRFQTPDSRCVRLLFFREKLSKDDLFRLVSADDVFLGYSVVRPTRPNCIGRTLLKPSPAAFPKTYMRLCKEVVNLQGVDFEVEGFPFISQDCDVTVCAQSALWALLRYYSNRYGRYSELYPYQIGTLTSDYSIGRMFPSTGLQMWQMAEVLRRCNLEPVIYSRKGYPEFFDHLLYTYIESGIPCLVGVPRHVVVAYGHHSDISEGHIPDDKKVHFSSSFNRALLINDDNRHPYQLLRDGGEKESRDSKFKFADIDEFIVPLPGRVFLSAEGFQAAAIKLLDTYRPSLPSLQNQTIVARILLTTGRSFKRRLSARGMGDAAVEKTYRTLPLPHYVWVCELSTPALYAQKRVVGEILWDATRNAAETTGWIALHAPEKFIFDQGSALNLDQNLVQMPLQGAKDYPLFSSNLEPVDR